MVIHNNHNGVTRHPIFNSITHVLIMKETSVLVN